MSTVRAVVTLALLATTACSSGPQPTPVPTSSAPPTASATPTTPSTPPPSAPTTPTPSTPPSTSPSTPPNPSPAPSGSPSPSGSPGIGHKTGAGDLIVRETVGGGFINPAAQLYALPTIVIYGDGTILAPDATGSTTGAVPQMTRLRVTERGLQAILSAARDAGLLGKNARYEGGPVADAATTTFTVIADGRTHTVSAYALGHPGTAGVDPATAEARRKLEAFDQALQDIPTLVGASEVADAAAPYQPAALQVFVSVGQDAGQGAPTPLTIAWPLGTPLDAFGQPVPVGSGGGGGVRPPDLRCGVVQGADLATLSPLLATADFSTVWTSAGKPYALTIRPQLPEELGCPGA